METETGVPYYYQSSATIEPVTLAAGQTYWMSIRAVLPVDEADPYSGWRWTLGNEVVDCPALCISPYWEIPAWTVIHDHNPDYPGDDAMAFRLHGGMSTATDVESWSGVKALY